MTNKPILVTVLALKPSFEDLLVPELAPLIEASRQIKGCLIFDLYRLSKDQSTLILHEVWNTREALEAFTLSPLKSEMTSVIARFLVQPLLAWEVEEVD